MGDEPTHQATTKRGLLEKTAIVLATIIAIHTFFLVTLTSTETNCRNTCVSNYEWTVRLSPQAIDYHMQPYAFGWCERVCWYADRGRRVVYSAIGIPVPLSTAEEQAVKVTVEAKTKRRFWEY